MVGVECHRHCTEFLRSEGLDESPAGTPRRWARYGRPQQL